MFASEAAKVIGIDLVKLAVTDRQTDRYVPKYDEQDSDDEYNNGAQALPEE